MKFFIDTADLEEIRQAKAMGVLDGETTNPEARQLAAIHQHVVVKVPLIAEGIKAIKTLTAEGIRTNCTLVSHPLTDSGLEKFLADWRAYEASLQETSVA